MQLADLPLVFVLAGLIFYIVLGGADFGAGFWQLTAGEGPRSESIREHAHHAMGPVWEANHVWLVFVLTVTWTAYPVAFGSIASTLSIPLFVAGIGIILRGTAYVLRSGTGRPRERRTIETMFAVSSILTPFALGTVVGGIASLRVPVGNAAGDLITSWLNPTSIAIGALAVATSAYMAAVFLSGDAARIGDPDLERRFRARAVASGIAAGVAALAALIVLADDAHALFHRLVAGRGLPALVTSIVAGCVTLALVYRRRYEPARYSATVAVAAIVTGWGLAQAPVLLRGLTIDEAAAPHDTLVAVTVAVLAGAVILFPSLALLFRLVLGGAFERELAGEAAHARGRALAAASARGLLARIAGGCLVVGVGFTTIAESGWAHAIGVSALLAFVAVGFPAALPPEVLPGGEDQAASVAQADNNPR